MRMLRVIWPMLRRMPFELNSYAVSSRKRPRVMRNGNGIAGFFACRGGLRPSNCKMSPSFGP
jgi:hypothetical protein